MTDDKIAEIRARHESPGVMLPMEALGQAIADRAALLAEVEKLRAERDTLLLDARDFVRWFNRHYPDPTSNPDHPWYPDHPWCALNDRLNAYADVLATFDSGVETKEEAKS